MEVPSRFEIDDVLWAEIEPLIPVRQRRRRHPGVAPAGGAHHDVRRRRCPGLTIVTE